MRDVVARDLTDSALDFKRAVWPAIRSACGGGDIEPVEAVTGSGLHYDLDTLSGIDAQIALEALLTLLRQERPVGSLL